MLEHWVGRLFGGGENVGCDYCSHLIWGERTHPASVSLADVEVRGADETLGPVIEAEVVVVDRQAVDHARDQAPTHEAWQLVVIAGQPVSEDRGIPREEFVASVAAQGNLHMLSGEPRQKVCRNDRSVRHRLIE